MERYTTEIIVDVEVEVTDAARATPGRYGDRPEESSEAEGEAVVVAVRLRRGGDSLDITRWLPAEVLEGLAEEALERLIGDRDEP